MSDMQLSEAVAVIGVIDPDAYSATDYLTAAIDMADYEQIMVVLQVGDLGASASVAATVQSSATSGGTYATVSGKTATVGGTSPNTGSNTQQVINVRSGEITDNNRYVKVQMTVATATSDCGLLVLGVPRHKPAKDFDLSTVTVN